MLTLIAIAVFVVVSMAVFAIGSLLDQRSARARLLRDRLASVQKAAERQPSEELALLRDEMLSEIPALDSLLRRSARIANLQTLLSQADLKIRAGTILMLCVLSGVGLALLVLILSPFPQFAWLGMIIGALMPYSYASFRRARRFQKFEELFPEAIDTLARAVRAGHAFTTALELISNEISEPISSEFRKLFEEQKFGLPVRDALLNLTERVPLVDVKFFVTAVMLQRETGGNLAEILDNLSYLIRERFKIMRQVRVYTAQGRLTMMLLMGLPPNYRGHDVAYESGLHSAAICRSHRPHPDRRRHNTSNRGIFHHPKNHSDSGLKHGTRTRNRIVLDRRSGSIFLRSGRLCAVFGIGLAFARPGMAKSSAAGEASIQRAAGTGARPFEQGAALVALGSVQNSSLAYPGRLSRSTSPHHVCREPGSAGTHRIDRRDCRYRL